MGRRGGLAGGLDRRRRYRAGVWEAGVAIASSLVIDGEQVVGGREAAIEDPDGGSTVDTEARIAIEAILNSLRTHGLIEGA